jgi:hypothetical protein
MDISFSTHPISELYCGRIGYELTYVREQGQGKS